MAINHFEASGKDTNSYKYFNPENAKNLDDAAQAYNTMIRIENNDLGFIGLIVTVSKKGVELGTASLWGVDTDTTNADYLEILNALAPDAIVEAEAKLKEILATP